MTLKSYSDKLAELAKKYPEALVVCSSDDEGNSFYPTNFGPTVGKYNNGVFHFDDATVEFQPNAVCLN